ncbi:endonuclease III domain-containing protein [Candidatus Dependentiae bacterium]
MFEIVEILRGETEKFEKTLVSKIILEYGHDPFLILISCLLSLRSRDSVTIHVCRKLFDLGANTPEKIVAMDVLDLENIIKPIGFFRGKAKTLISVCAELISRFGAKVPDTEKDLLSIKGIGRKTANLVLGVAFGKLAICVDIHVHRISNRLGLVRTKTPEETEFELKKILPMELWTEWNELLVLLGQNVCLPRFPRCENCVVWELCTLKQMRTG